MISKCGEFVLCALTELIYRALFETLIPIVIEFISIPKSIANDIGWPNSKIAPLKSKIASQF